MNQVTREMERRAAAGLDPLTGRPLATSGAIRWGGGGRLVDGTGREVALTDRGDWGYREDAR